MRRTLIITDLTEMQQDRVCVAGVDADYRCVRPTLPLGIHRYLLRLGNTLIIYPRAKVDFDLSTIEIAAPHIEDMQFDPNTVEPRGAIGDDEWATTLDATCYPSVEDIFDGYLQPPRWVAPGAPTRSLGTITGVQMLNLTLGSDGSGRGRINFMDAKERRYSGVPVADLAFRAFAASEVARLGSAEIASGTIASQFRGSRKLYLRLGLTRPWLTPGYGDQPLCWMQITGVHTLPDYLEGKTFADFATEPQGFSSA